MSHKITYIMADDPATLASKLETHLNSLTNDGFTITQRDLITSRLNNNYIYIIHSVPYNESK